MIQFEFTTIGGSESGAIEVADTDRTLRLMQSRPIWEGVVIFPTAKLGPDGEGQFPRLSLSWHREYGYEIQCFETPASNSEFLASAPTLSLPEVYIELGGQGQELWPRELFVSLDLATRALRYFLEDGRQDPELHWVGISVFPRRTVRARHKKY